MIAEHFSFLYLIFSLAQSGFASSTGTCHSLKKSWMAAGDCEAHWTAGSVSLAA